MNLKQYFEQQSSQSCLAKTLGVSPGMIYQWQNGIRPISIGRCPAIEKATNGLVTRRDLRPDDWSLIWPELQEREVA